MVFTECWLPKTHSIPQIENYRHFKTNNNLTQNEGVVVYLKKTLNVQIDEPTISECNCISIQINMDTIVVAIYRPYGYSSPTKFIESLSSYLLKQSKFKNIILIGDININIIVDDNDSSFYLDTLATHGMLPSYTFPTREKSCLDHIILKTKLPAFCYVAETSVTDHNSTIILLETNPKHYIRHQKLKKTINFENVDIDLKKLNLNTLYSIHDADMATSYLINNVNNILLANTTITKTSNRRKIHKPWITPGILRCLRNRDKLHQKTKKYPNNNIITTTYKRYRNYCNQLLKKLKIEYNKLEISKAAKISNKKLWTAITTATNITRKNTDKAIELITENDAISSTNRVNAFFINVGKELAEKIIPSSMISAHSQPSFSHPHSLVLLDVDNDEIESTILNLKSDCAVGRDNISGSFLKKYRSILIPPITYICNLALATGVFPKDLKLAEVHPIHKSGDRDCVNNYRPISILPTISKILEKVINKRLTNYLEGNRLLSEAQYGFRSNKSTDQAVDELTNYVATNLDAGKKVIVIFLDLAKAFDTVSVPLLLSKLENLGIRHTQHKLFEDYLTDRFQRVKINECNSDDLPISHGVPQGSILGPTLFLAYINDLCGLQLENGRIIAFADDTALLFSADTWNDAFVSAQSGFNKVTDWLRENKLTLNVEKTKYITFTKTNYINRELDSLTISAHTCPQPHTSCDCPILSRTNTIKYLGVLIDNTLSFKPHIELLTKRIRKLIYIFKNLRHIADANVIKMVHFALCQSLLSYCVTSWGGTSKTNILPLERALRLVLKVSYFLPRLYSTNDLFKRCSVLSVRQIFILHTLLLQHSKLTYDPSHENKRRKHDVCTKDTFRSKFSNKFFCFLGSYLYNKANKILNLYPLTRKQFKKKVTDWLLTLSYEATEDLLAVIN